MSRCGEVLLAFGDGEGPGENGEYLFRLGLAEWRKLDERFGVGPYELLRRMTHGQWKIDYPREVIRLGLQAGGSCLNGTVTDDQRINRLVREYVDSRPMLNSVALAARVLEAAMWEPPDDEIPKSQAAESVPRAFQKEDSPSPPSMDGDQSSGIRPENLTHSPSGNSEPSSPASRSRTGAKQRSRRRPEMSTTP